MYDGHLPSELIPGILTSLPVKSLLRFRCVCKQWCSLISNPNFISNHLKQASTASTRAFVRWDSLTHRYTCYNVFDNQNFSDECTRVNPTYAKRSRFFPRVLGYCYGVFCLFYDYSMTIILWNPCIRRAINVPLPKITHTSYGVYTHVLGFGFDAKNSDYKVVRLGYNDNPDKVPPKVDIFSVNSGRWSLVENKTRYCITEYFSSQATLDGVVHWVGFIPNEEARRERNLIVAFDMSTNTFLELGLPEFLENSPVINMGVTILTGSISILFYASKARESGKCAIWVMKEYGNVKSWVNQYNVSLEGILNNVFDTTTTGEIVFTSENGELVLYNCESGKTKIIGIRGMRLSFFVNKYVESFAFSGMGDTFDLDYEDENELIKMHEDERIIK